MQQHPADRGLQSRAAQSHVGVGFESPEHTANGGQCVLTGFDAAFQVGRIRIPAGESLHLPSTPHGNSRRMSLKNHAFASLSSEEGASNLQTC